MSLNAPKYKEIFHGDCLPEYAVERFYQSIQKKERAEQTYKTKLWAVSIEHYFRKMSLGSPRRLADLLASGRLGHLTREAKGRRGLTDRIRTLLPADQAKHLISASTNDAGELILLMDASVWAARVRYSAKQLGVHRIRVKVLPHLNQSDNPGTN